MSNTHTLADILEQAAASRPDHPFWIGDEETLSYRAFWERTGHVAAGLHSYGLKRGERVAILMSNGVGWLEFFFAAARLGAVAVPINPTFKLQEVNRILANSGAVVLVTDRQRAEMTEQLFAERLTLRRVFCTAHDPTGPFDPCDTLRDIRRPTPPVELSPTDTASLIYTSGTSGTPRGVLLSHASYDHTGGAFADAVHLSSDDRLMSTLPLCHASSQILGPLAVLKAGATLIAPRPQPLEMLVRRTRATEASVLAGAPQLFVQLTRADIDTDRLDGLRMAICTGAAIESDVHRRFEQRFATPLVTSYGLTEACGISTVNGPRPERREFGAIGMPLPGQRLRVVDRAGRERRPFAVGELTIYGPNLMQGYVGEQEATTRALRDGWLHTGDLGYVDQEGFFFLVSRLKDLIVRADEHIYPGEIEVTLRRHPAVAEAAVIGVPIDERGEEVTVFIVVEEGHSLGREEVVAYCREHLADYKCPGVVEFRDALPMTPTGRVRKALLKQHYTERHS